MTTGTPIYLDDTTYHALKAKLAQMVGEPFERFCSDPETEVVTALGEIANIWPESVMDDAECIDFTVPVTYKVTSTEGNT